ncbi:HK97-gp10 family putative phage morphogenesis protein [Paracoccus sp. (in: a-proteobacteria)]|uniref:HK97-gp10 family putative phage morphogenesis protein n=1 Tax=Paracoccus sp. TaxID=267 RepID=UPI0040580B6E
MIKMKMDGLKGLENAIKDLEQISGRHTRGKAAIKRSLKAVGQQVADKANDIAPDGSEWNDKNIRLRGSFNVSEKLNRSQKKKHRRNRDKTAVEMFIGTYVNYSHFPEFGTVKQAAQPSLTPAWESLRQKVLDDLIDELWNQILTAIPRAQKAAAKKAARG